MPCETWKTGFPACVAACESIFKNFYSSIERQCKMPASGVVNKRSIVGIVNKERERRSKIANSMKIKVSSQDAVKIKLE